MTMSHRKWRHGSGMSVTQSSGIEHCPSHFEKEQTMSWPWIV
jgi:hypothetical protein